MSYVSPSEEELFKRYNPDLQRRSLENREERQQAYDDYVTRLKQAAKSDKPSMPNPLSIIAGFDPLLSLPGPFTC